MPDAESEGTDGDESSGEELDEEDAAQMQANLCSKFGQVLLLTSALAAAIGPSDDAACAK